MTTKLLLASALIALLTLPASAQQAPQGTPTRIRGAVEKLDGQALTVKSREGQTLTVALADNVAVAYLVKKNVGDIKPGDFIASTGSRAPTASYMRSRCAFSPSRCAAPARDNTRGISRPIQ